VRIEGAIHVAGVIDADEAEMLIDCGVGFLGFPLVLGYHKEDLRVTDAAGIVARVGDRATFFLITYLAQAKEIAALCATLKVGVVQLHADVDVAELVDLRRAEPGLRIVKSLIVRGDNTDALEGQVAEFAPHVDAFITDTYDPETGASGATGRTHDWAVSRRLVELSPKPVILAGGLTASNVREAIEFVRPAGVDVHTGIELSDGRKGRDLTIRFVAEALAGFTSIRP
jgi:phosphoribosylanthranilate isomerase